MAARTQEEVLRLLFQTDGEEDIAATAKILQELGRAADGSGKKAKSLLEELQKLGSTADGIQKFTRLKGEIAETGAKITETAAKLTTLRREIDASAAPNDKLAKSFDRTQAELDKLMRLQNRQSAELTKAGHALRAAGVDTDKLGAAYDQLQGQLGAVTKEAGGLAAGAGKLKKTTDDAGESLKGLTVRLGKVSAATAAASAALLAFGGAKLFKGAIDSSLEFEQAMSQVAAVSGATGDELQALKAAAEAGGLATKFSALEAAEGLAELARATGSAKTAIAALPAVLNLAQAAGIGVAEAAGFVTTTLAQFGLEAAEAARVADVLALGANSTQASVQGMGNALTYAAPLAKQLGLTLEETAAIIGEMADQGFQGERAGTALRNVFSAMQDPANAFSKALRDIGIDSTNFIDVIEQLSTGGAAAERAMLSLDAAARPAILALVNSGSAGLRELAASLQNAAGSAENTAAIMGDNVGGAIEHLTEVYNKAKRDFVEPLLAPLRGELDQLATELEAFANSAEFAEIQSAFKELFVEGAAAARDFLKEVDFKQAAQDIRDFVDNSRENLGEFRQSIEEVVIVVEALGTTISVIFNSIQTLVFGLAAAVTGAIALVANVANELSGPQKALLDFLGVSTEGFRQLEDFAAGTAGVANEFAARTAANFIDTGEAMHSFGDIASETSERTASGLIEVVAASDAAAEGSTALGDAAAVAADGLAAQADAASGAAGETSKAAAESEAAAARIDAAFADLGIKSRRDLEATAGAARRNFQLIADAARDGQGAVDDVRAAFVAYGQAALDAVKNADASAKARVAGELAVEASVNGVSDALVDLGITSDRVGQRVVGNIRSAVPPLRELEGAARGAAQATDAIAAGSTDAASGLRAMGAAAGTTTVGVFQLNGALLEAFSALSKFAGSPTFGSKLSFITEEIKRQTDAVSGLNAELDRQVRKMDPLSKELEALQAQYNFVDEATLRQLAEKRVRIKEERERAADERKALRKDRAEASQDIAAEPSPQAESRGSQSRVSGNGPAQSRLFVVRLVAADSNESHDLPVQGNSDLFSAFMQDLQRHRSTSSGGR